MNNYAISLYSVVNTSTTVWIEFFVRTEMTARQLKIYYECKSTKISNVEVELL